MQLGSPSILKRQVRHALGVLVLCLAVLPALGVNATPADPDPLPHPRPDFYDPSGVFNDGQQATLARDAMLLQSSNIPIVVYVRTVSAEDADPAASHAFAESVRASWKIETTAGADDGLVLLYSHVPNHPQASTVVASWGTATFAKSGLTPAYIESVLGGDVRALLDQGHPFEALVYGMREIRYGGIYFPPSPAPLEGSRKTLNAAVNTGAPLLLAAVVVAYLAISLRRDHLQAMSVKTVWCIVGATGLLASLLAVASIVGRSRIGIGCLLLMLAALALQTWLWTHPPARPSRFRRYRSVPPTARRMRKQRQTRRMHALPDSRP